MGNPPDWAGQLLNMLVLCGWGVIELFVAGTLLVAWGFHLAGRGRK